MTGEPAAAVSAPAGDGPRRLGRVVVYALAITPVRLALGGAVLGVARSRGLDAGAGLLAFATGAVATAVLVGNDPRRRFLQPRGAPVPAPADAVVERWPRLVAAAAFPSTVGVSVLATVALALGRETLAAVLGGILAGLGLASLAVALAVGAQERRDGRTYFLERGSGRLYEREQP